MRTFRQLEKRIVKCLNGERKITLKMKNEKQLTQIYDNGCKSHSNQTLILNKYVHYCGNTCNNNVHDGEEKKREEREEREEKLT